MLVHLPNGYKTEQVRDALTAKIKTIPDILRASLTWDQGAEMGAWKEVSVAADIDIYFCDPHSPWQRGTSENTNGLLRQYFPKGTDLSVHSALDRMGRHRAQRPTPKTPRLREVDRRDRTTTVAIPPESTGRPEPIRRDGPSRRTDAWLRPVVSLQRQGHRQPPPARRAMVR